MSAGRDVRRPSRWRERSRPGCDCSPCRTPRSPSKSASTPTTIRATGCKFLLAANPGLPLLPLNRVASGGELARSMLALRLVLVGRRRSGSEAGTLVFDEVDAGIGGEAAQAVGDALADLAGHHQVLVVTHLAQVAAAADTQISVSKTVRGGSTFAAARPARRRRPSRRDRTHALRVGDHSQRSTTRGNYSREVRADFAC